MTFIDSKQSSLFVFLVFLILTMALCSCEGNGPTNKQFSESNFPKEDFMSYVSGYRVGYTYYLRSEGGGRIDYMIDSTRLYFEPRNEIAKRHLTPMPEEVAVARVPFAGDRGIIEITAFDRRRMECRLRIEGRTFFGEWDLTGDIDTSNVKDVMENFRSQLQSMPSLHLTGKENKDDHATIERSKGLKEVSLDGTLYK